MPRTRAILADPDRNLISTTLMDAQVLQDETARILADRVKVHVAHSRKLRRAQERLTASEARAEREEWDGACRRRNERRAAAKLAAEMQVAS